jgi:choline-sulfatase
MNKQPNIILCTCDQLRSHEVGCYGNSFVRTPNIDRLAGEGVRFRSAVTSFPVCMAARSSMLSGQYPRRCTGGVDNVSYPLSNPKRPGERYMPEYPEAGRPHLPDPTLPELLRADGYHTAVIGKWHIHSWPQEVGFDRYTIPRVHHCHSGQSFTRDGGPEFSPPGWSVDFEAGEVEAFLEQRRQAEEPFFLYYNISPPHCPVADAPERYLTMYRPEEVPLRPNVDETTSLREQDLWFKIYRWDFRHYVFHLPYTEQLPAGYSLRHLIAEYCGMVTWVDDTVGRLLQNLSRAGLDQDTIVIFTSDHGDNLGSHGRVQKSSLNEESISVPLVVRWPGGPRGRVINEQVASLVDLMPTLLESAGLEVPGHVHGQSLAPVIEGLRERLERDYTFVECRNGVAIRTPRYVYSLPWAQADGAPHPTRTLAAMPDQFFDLHTDPYQLHPLSIEGDFASLARELDGRLRHWHHQTAGMTP